MNSRNRVILMCLGFIVMGVCIFLLSTMTQPKGSQPPETPPGPQPLEVEKQAESAPEPPTPVEERVPAESAPLAEPVEEVEETSVAKGRARIHGTVKTADGGPIPGDMRIAITRYPEKVSDIPTLERMRKTTPLDAEGKFSFTELPYGRFSVFAESATYTGNSSANLTRERRESERTITLYPAATISGVVVDPDGQPVPEATVYAGAYVQSGSEVSLGLARSFSTETKTDAQGNFVVSSLQFREPPIQYRLLAQADGFASHNSEILQPNAQNVRIVLSPGSFASGYAVHRDTGEPVPDLKLTTQTKALLDQKTAKTDTEGWFILGPLEPGSYEVATEDSKWLIVPETAKFQMASNNDTEDLNVAFLMGGIVTGRVYDTDTNRGIAGVGINAYSEDDSGARGESETDSDGNYRMEGLQAATYRMQYRDADGYPDYDYNEQRKITVSLAQEFDSVDFPLSRGITISGIVVDEEGKPLSEASVSGNAQSNNGGSSTRDNTRTTGNGRFTLAGFTSGQKVNVSASKSEMAGEPIQNLQVTESSITGLKIVMGPGGSISGSVIDANGAPVPAGNMLWGRMEGDTPPRSRRIDNFSGGKFSIEPLRAGKYQIYAGADYNNPRNKNSTVTISVAAGEHKEGVRLLYDGTGNLSIAGHIVDEQGRPIQDARLLVFATIGQYIGVDENGHFKHEGLSEGRINVRAEHPSYTQVNTGVEAGDQNIKIVMKAASVVRGFILSKGTGRPVQDFEMMVQPGEGPIQPHNYRDFSRQRSENGAFTLPSVQAGANLVAVRANGFANTEFRLDNIQSGETREGVIIHLETGNHLTGRVLNAQGQPVNGAMIFEGEMPRWNPEQVALTKTAGSGNFKLDTLPSGAATIFAAHPNYATNSQTVNIRAGIQNRVDIQLMSGGGVEGYVTQNGKPLKSNYVSVSFERQNKNAQTDADGYYQIGGLPEGTVRVNTSIQNAAGGHRSLNGEVTVTNEMTTRFDFDFKAASSSVEGQISADGESVTQARINIRIALADGTNESRYVEVDSSGYYEIDSLPAGNISMSVYAQGFNQKQVSFTLAEKENKRQDVNLLAGATVACQVRNIPANASMTYVSVLTGEVNIPATLDMTFAQSLGSRTAGGAQVIDGVATISGLEPGTYTFMAGATIGERDPQDPFANMKIATEVIEISDDKDVDVTLRF